MNHREVRVLNRTFRIEWGHLAHQANGAVLVRENDTVVLVAVVADSAPRPGTDFFPLTVEYRERFSAAGRFPGGYRKREGQASTHEILTSRLIDRSIRPLFPESFRCETQVFTTVLAFDPDGDPGLLSILGASAALTLSDLPWDGPVAGIRMARSVEGGWLAFPNAAERGASPIDLVATYSHDGLVMAEGGASELTEAELLEAFAAAHERLQPVIEMLSGLRADGKPKRPLDSDGAGDDLASALEAHSAPAIRAAVQTHEKQARRTLLAAARAAALTELLPRHEGGEADLAAGFDALVERLFREEILERGRRADGRVPEEIRPIQSQVAWLPRVHGSALFTRGETQAIVVCTLGTGQDEQEVEGLTGTARESFQLYYRFPSYSVGEVRPIRGPGRREIGHGHLALRALEAVLPAADRFPYTIKVESEIASSNGSSSMATVCGGCLALMDAGVPITRPVAGIAMGLIRSGDRQVILSDILGDEDHLGDMDFKVAGTEQGVTAIQLDNKIGAVPVSLLGPALEQARRGRLHILGEMRQALAAPRPELSPNAPRVAMVQIGRHRIRDLIGPGGRIIQALQADTQTKVDVTDDGRVRVYATRAAGLETALRRIRYLTGEPEVGKVYRGTVTGVKDFGAFVKIFEGIEGLVHVSELADGHVRETGEVAREGAEMTVKVLGVDPNGKIRLSRKQALKVPQDEIEETGTR
jgi:polyribonucleotide nucleotidyltransferase